MKFPLYSSNKSIDIKTFGDIEKIKFLILVKLIFFKIIKDKSLKTFGYKL